MYQGHRTGFEMAPGETHPIALGAPYKLRVETKQDGKELVVGGNTLRIFGRGGEEWAKLSEKLQVRLTQKSQALLGGPFDSDWTP